MRKGATVDSIASRRARVLRSIKLWVWGHSLIVACWQTRGCSDYWNLGMKMATVEKGTSATDQLWLKGFSISQQAGGQAAG